jgi:hypothetical protein
MPVTTAAAVAPGSSARQGISISGAGQAPVVTKANRLRKALVIGASVVILAGLGVGGWLGYLKIRMHNRIGKLPPGLTAFWSGEDKGSDALGDNPATLTDVSIKKSERGAAFSFDEAGSGIKMAASQALNVGTGGGFTLMAWIKPSDLTQRNELFEWNSGTPNQVVTWGVHVCLLKPQELNLGEGNLFADVHGTDGRPHQIMARGGTITANVFQQVALTYDKGEGTARLFCNGKIVAEQKIGQVTPQTTYDFYLGRRPAGDGSHSFSGQISEAGIFNRALTAAEIEAVYASQNKN